MKSAITATFARKRGLDNLGSIHSAAAFPEQVLTSKQDSTSVEIRKRRKDAQDYPHTCSCSVYGGDPHLVKNRYEAYRHAHRESIMKSGNPPPPIKS